jgi:hypothetical protein
MGSAKLVSFMDGEEQEEKQSRQIVIPFLQNHATVASAD